MGRSTSDALRTSFRRQVCVNVSPCKSPEGGEIQQPGAQRSGALGGVATALPKAPPGRDSLSRGALCGAGISARWAWCEWIVTYPGLRRLSRLRPGLSNLAPFGALLRKAQGEPSHENVILEPVSGPRPPPAVPPSRPPSAGATVSVAGRRRSSGISLPAV